jgi:hypothetical protein
MADDRLGGRRTPRIDDRGRTPFIWVQDDDTGHRYDVLETALRDGMTPVDGVEPNYTGRARRPKYRTDLAGNDATRTPADEGAPPPSTGEATPTTITPKPKGGTRS